MIKLDPVEQTLIGLVIFAICAGAYFRVGNVQTRYRQLIAATTLLTLVLVVLGAFVRLSDAGLGCPDWPGCYGNLTPHHSADAIAEAEKIQPGGPVSLAKAWKEMVHRYLAMLVGSLIAAMTLLAWRHRQRWGQAPTLPIVTSAAVIFQAALGAWTVTLLLKPAIVTAHLIGGITIFALLIWHLLRQPGEGRWRGALPVSTPIRQLALASLLVVGIQIVLGGWVSTNYAALACTDFPTCHQGWLPEMDFSNAFHIIRPLGVAPDGSLLTLEALTAIHWSHRVGAILVALIAGSLGVALLKTTTGKAAGSLLLALLFLQIGLGISNVVFSLPIPIAVAHNGCAALLFAWLLVINWRARQANS